MAFAPFASAEIAQTASSASSAEPLKSGTSDYAPEAATTQALDADAATAAAEEGSALRAVSQDEAPTATTSESAPAEQDAVLAAANDAHTITVPTTDKNEKPYTVTVPDVACKAGERVSIPLTIAALNDDVSKNENTFTVGSVDISGVGSVSFNGSGLSDDIKKGTSTTLSFTADIPESAMGGTFSVTVTVENHKSGKHTLKIKLTVTAVHQGVMCVSAADNGSKLSGYQASYDPESVAFAFDMLNYNADDASYAWDFKLEASTTASGPFEDVTSAIDAQWATPLPGASAQGVSGEATAPGSAIVKSVVSVDTSGIDHDGKNVVYRATLQVTDKNTGNVSEQSAMVYRRINDLSSHTFKLINVGKAGSNSQSVTTYDTKVGTAWFDSLYYDNVAKDPRVPFSDAESLRNYLSSLPEGLVDVEINKYIYDMYNPNSALNKGDDYSDATLKGWYKDGNTPFHATASSGVNNLSYSLADGGVTYSEDYFQNLKKSAQIDGRTGSISISADAKPVPREPRVYLIRTQGSWQMFDMAHALSDDGKGIMYSSIKELATYYDVKQALLRFSKFLEEKSGGSVALGFLTFSHAGEYTMFTDNGYLCNDPSTIELGLRGWDTFGDCEHSHYSDGLLETALKSVPGELANWKDSDGNLIASQVSKTAIFIGGPCEPTNGSDGYAVSLPQDLLASNMNHAYGIQTVDGTSNIKDKQGNTIQSWLDYEGDGKKDSTNNRVLWAKQGNGFYVAPSEDDIYNALVDIYNKDADNAITKYGTVKASVSDTVQKEFKVISATATWTSAVDGSVVNVPADNIKVVDNDDGTTTVTCDYGECKGTGTVKLDIAIAAQDDYIGGNNDLTNVDVPHLTFTGKEAGEDKVEQTFEKDFTDKPDVNVSLLDMNVSGGEGTHQVNQEFDLANHATADLKDLLTGYPQTNGTLTLTWVETDENGAELPNQTISFTPGSNRIEGGELSGAGNITLPTCKVNSDVVTTRHFKLKATYTPDEAKNDLKAAGVAQAEADVTLRWVDQKMVSLRITKVASGNEQTPLEHVGFNLYEDEGLTKPAGVYTDATLSERLTADGAVTDGDGHAAFYGLELGKTYYLKETKAAAGYSLSSQVWTVVAQSDSQVTINGQPAPGATVEQGSSEYYQARITIENEKAPSLPVAGALGQGLALIGGLLALAGLCACAWQLRKRRVGGAR